MSTNPSGCMRLNESRVCRPEIYRVKSLIHRGLKHLTLVVHQQKAPIDKLQGRVITASSGGLGSDNEEPATSSPPQADLSKQEVLKSHWGRLNASAMKLLSLVHVFDKILKEEDPGQKESEIPVYQPLLSNPCRPSSSSSSATQDPGLTCDFCGADIFYGFFDCEKCAAGDEQEESIVICPGCYVEGRTCKCSEMMPKVLRPFADLCADRERARDSLQRACRDPQELCVQSMTSR